MDERDAVTGGKLTIVAAALLLGRNQRNAPVDYRANSARSRLGWSLARSQESPSALARDGLFDIAWGSQKRAVFDRTPVCRSKTTALKLLKIENTTGRNHIKKVNGSRPARVANGKRGPGL